MIFIIFLLSGGQQVAVRAASACPQVFQFPNQIQQTMSVQIPVSQNGQTVLQTVQIPVQVFQKIIIIYFQSISVLV